MRRYCEAPIGLLGKLSVEDELKLVSWQDKLLGIGWELDFKALTVKPGPRARRKLLWRWWVCMPRDVSHAIPRKALESALASATYYSVCIPLLNAFFPSIRNCFYMGKQNTMHVRLSPMAQTDCEWIKAIVWIVGNRPELIEKSIDCMCRINRTRFMLETDASTEVGGGGILSDRNPDDSRGKILDTCYTMACNVGTTFHSNDG